MEEAMNLNRAVSMFVALGFIGALVAPGFAQQPSTQAPAQAPPRPAKTIDCPPAAAAATPSGGAVGSPQGAGTGSGLSTMPSAGASQQVEGAIKSIGSTRTNRIVEVGDLKIEVEPSTVVLVDCKQASVADLKVGSKVKVAYEMKPANRHLATVIEAQN
jgi:hypothetical protein